jgi:hypothetical protein
MRGFWSRFFLKSTEKERRRELHDYYQAELKTLNDKIKELEEMDNTYYVAPPVRGIRYKKIVYPESMDEYKEWLMGELRFTLTSNGKIEGNEFFLSDETERT